MLGFVEMGDETSVPPTVATTGLVSGNETVFGYSDDDVIPSGSDIGHTVPG